jgi:hypothetical protein
MLASISLCHSAQAVFNAYCRYASGTSRGLASGGGKEGEHEPRMNAAQLMKLVHDLDLLSGGDRSRTGVD